VLTPALQLPQQQQQQHQQELRTTAAPHSNGHTDVAGDVSTGPIAALTALLQEKLALEDDKLALQADVSAAQRHVAVLEARITALQQECTALRGRNDALLQLTRQQPLHHQPFLQVRSCAVHTGVCA
jgi:phage shock protein A